MLYRVQKPWRCLRRKNEAGTDSEEGDRDLDLTGTAPCECDREPPCDGVYTEPDLDNTFAKEVILPLVREREKLDEEGHPLELLDFERSIVLELRGHGIRNEATLVLWPQVFEIFAHSAAPVQPEEGVGALAPLRRG